MKTSIIPDGRRERCHALTGDGPLTGVGKPGKQEQCVLVGVDHAGFTYLTNTTL